MSRIFISHSSEDREQSARLLKWLRDEGFVSAFLDFDKHQGIDPGADWERTLYRELSSADAVILVLTKNWFASKWCFAEFAQARALGKAIFPLVESPTGESFVSSDIQHLDLVKDREGGLERLLSELTRISLNTRGGYAWDSSRPPYPGLLAFDEADAAIYFGRDDDIRRLIERLNARRAQGGEKLVLVLGASGSGKSSLLRAGIVPRLKRDAHNWIVLPPFRPQLHPLDELAQVVATGLGQPTEWRQWRDALAGDDFAHSLSDLARDLRAVHKQNEAQILLVIDQGEELFAGADAKQTDQFFRVLNALLDERLPFLAAMSLRSDFLGRLQQEPRLEAGFEQFSLKPMPLERVREIIEGPARVAGVAVDDGLVTAAMADARTEDALPLLAFALRELYDRCASSGRLTAEAYHALGDPQAQLSPLENAVRRKADEVLAAARPEPEDLAALKEAFIPAMVRVNAEGEYVRRPAPMESIPPRALPLIERLAKARLLTIHDEQGVRMVEVAHEALLRKWPLLRGWLDEEREFLVGKTQLEQDLADWERAAPEQKPEALLAGLKLTRARMWLLAKPQQLTAQERAFVQASVTRHEAEAARRERVRRRLFLAAIAAALVLGLVAIAALVAGAVAYSGKLAAQSMLDSSTDLGTAMQEAVNAAGIARTGEAEIALNAALGNPQERYLLHQKGMVLSAVFSPDGTRMVTAGSDGTARIWDSASGRLLLTLTGHADAVARARFSPDGKQVVTASLDRTAKVWDAASGRPLATLAGHTGVVCSAVFSPDGTRIATASFDKTARVWDASDGRLLFTLAGHDDLVTSAVFSPDGKRIVTASHDKTARVWDAGDGHSLATLAGHTDWVNSAVFSPDGRQILTASGDKTARVWDAGSGRALFTLTGHNAAVASAVFSPDGKRIATASNDATGRIWDAGDGHPLAALTGHTGSLMSIAWSADGKRIVTASTDHTARVWDAGDGHPLFRLAGHIGQIWSAVFSPDGKSVVTASVDGTARVWEMEDGRISAALTGHTGFVYCAAFSLDGKRVVTAGQDKTARVWDAGTGRLLLTLAGHTDEVRSAGFSRDGKRIVTASWDKTARVWDAGDGRLLATLTGHADKVNFAAFSPDGTRIATASADKTARVWDAASGRPLSVLTGHTDMIWSASFSPDGKRIATASSDGSVRLWDAANGQLLRTLSGRNAGAVFSATFSPDGKRIVAANQDDSAWVWDAGNGDLLAILTGHTGAVFSAVFSPDGKRVATASADGTARIFEVATGWFASWFGKTGGQIIATFAGQGGPVISVAYSPDGKHLATAGGAGTARINIVDFSQVLGRANQLEPVDSGD